MLVATINLRGFNDVQPEQNQPSEFPEEPHGPFGIPHGNTQTGVRAPSFVPAIVVFFQT